MRALAWALALGLAAGCAWRAPLGPRRARVGAMPAACADGGAPRVLVHPVCGVCGWSCLPDRWGS